MSVYDNLAFALSLRKVPKATIEQAVHRAVDMLGLGALLQRRPAHLSGGQRQRVALGRAIVRNPVVFLMDEPLSNLDASLRVSTRTEIKRLQRELGTTTIFVMHDREEAMVLSDRIAIMRDGRLQQLGTPHEIYADPVNQFVAGFIGSPKKNLLPGRIDGEGPEARFALNGEGGVPRPWSHATSRRPRRHAWRPAVTGVARTGQRAGDSGHDQPDRTGRRGDVRRPRYQRRRPQGQHRP